MKAIEEMDILIKKVEMGIESLKNELKAKKAELRKCRKGREYLESINADS